MKKHARSKASGQTLIAQGEPIVWLTGGMFAIACSMIVALLGLILYQGLATHWQRPFVMYPLNDGQVESGELQYQQPYVINRQSLRKFDPKTASNAEALLAGRDQTESTQLYLRSGNYDVTNHHFVFVPIVAIQSDPQSKEYRSYQPHDIWLLERTEWGVLYGFPMRLDQQFVPEADDAYAQHQVLVDNLDALIASGPTVDEETQNKWAAFKDRLLTAQTDYAKTHKEQWLANRTGGEASVNQYTIIDPKRLHEETLDSQARQSKVLAELEHAKEELGRTDRQLATARIGVRKAEIAEKTDLQSIADEAAQYAAANGIANAMWQDLQASIEAWRQSFKSDASSLETLSAIEKLGKTRWEQELQASKASLDELTTRAGSLPKYSQAAVTKLREVVESVNQSQFDWNMKIGRLESRLQSEVLVTQVPALEWLGEIDSWKENAKLPTEALTVMALDRDERAQSQDCHSEALSPTQFIVTVPTSQGQKRFWFTKANDSDQWKIATFQDKPVLVSNIVRLVAPNQLSWMGKLSLYVARWLEFLFGRPREAGIEGGFFPALWGTIVMTLIMSVAVMPFGVMAALFMREYAKSGWILSMIRISINNLAGVPSIVYGVFGLAFFCYMIGGYIDGGPVKAGFEPWPSGQWFVAVACTAIAGTAAFLLATMGSGSPAQMSTLRKRLTSFSGLFWLLCLIGLIALLLKTPFFHGFYEANLPNPTFGKGCLLWASLTLALLTLPVVIVATEEALAAVPNSLREGSYACGAGKWQTLQRIVLPYARPGIITGFILAMARGAGEVAPMMLVGAIPLATELPLDAEFPFFHGSRSFMHLGFQIYSLGFQSQNSEAAKPMVFTVTLLLLTIVTLLNITAIWLRARLRKRFQGSQF